MVPDKIYNSIQSSRYGIASVSILNTESSFVLYVLIALNNTSGKQ